VTPAVEAPRTRWIHYAACAWAVLFAAPHVWWALGIPAGFPGGERNHRLMMSSLWRYLFDAAVVALCGIAIWVALALRRPRGWMVRTAAWVACAMLTLRGLAGGVVDGASDLVWWPTFTIGGLLFAAVAGVAPRAVAIEPGGVVE
jgi:hypothetical protein